MADMQGDTMVVVCAAAIGIAAVGVLVALAVHSIHRRRL